MRTSAYHPETLRAQSLVPWHHRGRVPRCMKDYQNLVVLPLRRCISHAVPSAQLLKALAKLGPIVEVGAGSGYWSAMLHERGVDTIAYDLDPPDRPPSPTPLPSARSRPSAAPTARRSLPPTRSSQGKERY